MEYLFLPPNVKVIVIQMRIIYGFLELFIPTNSEMAQLEAKRLLNVWNPVSGVFVLQARLNVTMPVEFATLKDNMSLSY